MKQEVKEGITLMLSHTELPLLAKKSAMKQVQTEGVMNSIKEVYARIEKHRASSAQKDTANVDTSK